jgi:hypothetical protein
MSAALLSSCASIITALLLPAGPCCSEKKLRRLEIATNSPKLARLQLYRLLSHSESRWATELNSAGLTADGAPKPGEVLRLVLPVTQHVVVCFACARGILMLWVQLLSQRACHLPADACRAHHLCLHRWLED